MNLDLGISTSTGKLEIVIGKDEEIIFYSDYIDLYEPKNLNNYLNEEFKKINISFQDIYRIIVDIGPGGTSSVRTGVALANSLAYSLNIQVCSISSLELASIEIWNKNKIPVVSMTKSIKGNFFVGLYENEKLVSIKHGNLEEIVKETTENISEFVAVGFKTELLKDICKDKKIHNNGQSFGSIKSIISNKKMFETQFNNCHRIVMPITEESVS